MAVVRWVKRWSSNHRVVQADDVEADNKIFFSNDFYFSFMFGLMDFSDIVILCNMPNNCCQQNLKCFDEPLFS